MYGIKKTSHFLYCIGDEYRLKVIAIFQATANAGGNGIYVFQNRTVFNAYYIIADGSFDKAASQSAGKNAGFVLVRTSDGEV